MNLALTYPPRQVRRLESENQRLQDRRLPSLMDLPIELRSYIWDETLPSARVIPIRQSESCRFFMCSPPPPTALKVCRESRERALRRFKPLFTRNGTVEYPPVYIDPQVDILFLDFFDNFDELPRVFPELNTAYTIAVPESAMNDERVWLDSFDSVRRVLVTKDASKMWDERQYCDIHFRKDDARKAKEEEWTRYITDKRICKQINTSPDNHVPKVQAVYIYEDISLVYRLAKRELARVEREEPERLEFESWAWDQVRDASLETLPKEQWWLLKAASERLAFSKEALCSPV